MDQQSRYAKAPAIATRQPITHHAVPSLGLPAQWRCDLSDNSLRWQTGVYALFGVPVDCRLDRRDIVEMYTLRSRTLLEALRAQAIATCGSFTFEAEVHAADGAERWIRIVADTVSAGGRATHLYGTKSDVTDEMTGRLTLR